MTLSLTRTPLGLVALFAMAAVFVSARVTPGITWFWGILCGTLLLAWLCRRAVSNDPVLMRIALSSYALRIAVTLVFYAISAWRLPVLEGLQRGDGFLQIGGDGVGYHAQALQILYAWQQGLDLPFMFQTGVNSSVLYRDVSLPLAAFYALTGASVLHALLGNAWFGAASALPAYLLGDLMAGRRAGRWAALLIGFWPSFILWSTQLLKDSVALLAVLTAFYCIARFLGEERRFRDRVGAWLGLALAAGVLTYLRFYLGFVLVGAAGLVMGPAALLELLRWRPARTAAVLGVVAAIGLGVVAVRRTNFLLMCSPWHSLQGHAARADRLERAGDWDGMLCSRVRAVELAPRNPTQTRELLAAMWRLPNASVIPSMTRERALYLLENAQVPDEADRTEILMGVADMRQSFGDLEGANRIITNFLHDHPGDLVALRRFRGILEMVVRSEWLDPSQMVGMRSQVTWAEKSWRADPDLARVAASLYVRVGEFYQEMGAPDEAAYGYAQALQAVPHHQATVGRLPEIAVWVTPPGAWPLVIVERVLSHLDSCEESWLDHAPTRRATASLNSVAASQFAASGRLSETAFTAVRAVELVPDDADAADRLRDVVRRLAEAPEWQQLPYGLRKRILGRIHELSLDGWMDGEARRRLTELNLATGRLADRAGELEEAVAAYTRTLESTPGHPEARARLPVALAALAAARGSHVWLSPRMLRRAVALAPGSDWDEARLEQVVAFQLTAVPPPPAAPDAGDVADVPSQPLRSIDPTLWLNKLVQWFKIYRQGMVNTGGYSTVDTDVDFTSAGRLMAYAPRALALAFLSPFPKQWFYIHGETGVFRAFSAGEVVLIYLLVPLFVFGGWRLIRFHGELGRFMAVFSLLSALILGLIVANIGILFRLRGVYLAPLLVGIAVSWPGWRWRFARARLRLRRRALVKA